MAYDIGPKIGIDGEAEFRRAIQNINTNIKTLGTEMLAVTSAYDANDKSAAALTSRNEVLVKQIDAQKEKLAALQEGLAASADKYGENDEKTQRWQQTVNKATAELNQMERQLQENTQELEEQGGSLDKVKEKAAAFGAGLATAAKAAAVAIGAATAAVTAFAKSSIDVGMEFDSSMSQVAATMGTTVDQIQELRDFAMEMGASTAFSASQAADALNYMALAGYDAETSMDVLPTVLNLAAAGSIELASASDMVTDAQSALGLSIEETAEMVDKMAMASSKSNTSIEQLGEAILTVGGTAQNLAGGTTELSTALGILADNGIKGAEGGTHLRNVILALSTPTDNAASLLNDLGVAVFDAEGNMRPLNETLGDLNGALSTMTQGEQLSAISTIFNKTDIAAVNALLAGTAGGVVDIDTALSASGVNWDKYADKVWASGDAMDGLVADLLYNLTEIGTSAEELQEYLAMEYDIDADDAMKIIESVSAELEENGTRWDELSGYIDNAKDSAQNMADVQLDNLAGDITLFKSALEGAQIILSDQLTPTLRGFVQFGSEAISALSTAFQEGGLTGAMEVLGTILSDGLSMVIEQLPVMIDAGMQLLGGVAEGMVSAIPALAESCTRIVGSIVENIANLLPELATATLAIITTLSSGIADSLPELVPTIVDVVLQIVETLTDPANLDNLIGAALEIITALAEGLIGALPTLAERVPEIIANIVTTLTNNLPKIITMAGTIITTLANGLIQAIPNLVKSVPQIVTAVVNGFASLKSQFLGIGKNIVNGVWEGISAMASWIKEKVTGFFSGIVDGVKGVLGIHSPSKVFAGIGGYMAEGLSEGFSDEMGAVKRQIDRSMSELAGNAAASVQVSGGVPKQRADDASSYLSDLPSLVAAAVRQELDGVGVYLNQRKVGELMMSWQNNQARAMGV